MKITILTLIAPRSSFWLVEERYVSNLLIYAVS